jgi:drug/metabolite transporter (DMT)-like permease
VRVGDLRASSEARGIGLAVGSGVSFGTLAIVAKLAYDEGASPLPLLAARFALATLLIVIFCLATRRRLWPGRQGAVKLLLLGGFGYGLEASLFFLALEHAPAGVVGLIFYSFPIWTNIIGIVTGLEPPSLRVLIALVVGTAGVASIFAVSGAGLLGPLLALAAALVVAVYLILSQIVLRNQDAPTTALWTSAGAAITVGFAALVVRDAFPAAAVPHASALALASAVAFLLLYAAIKRIGSARSAIANMVEPITTVLLAALILAEELTLRIGIGALLVISALPILVSAEARRDVVTPSDSS